MSYIGQLWMGKQRVEFSVFLVCFRKISVKVSYIFARIRLRTHICQSHLHTLSNNTISSAHLNMYAADASSMPGQRWFSTLSSGPVSQHQIRKAAAQCASWEEEVNTGQCKGAAQKANKSNKQQVFLFILFLVLFNADFLIWMLPVQLSLISIILYI